MSATQLLGKDDLSHLGIDEDALDPWTQMQLTHVVTFCQTHGWSVYRVDEQQSKILHGILAVWLVSFTSHGKSKSAWIISGDLPTDIIPKGNSNNARHATLCFSKKFLLKAQRLRKQANRSLEKQQRPSLREQYLAGSQTSPEKTTVKPVTKSEQDNIAIWVKSAANLLILYHEQSLW